MKRKMKEAIIFMVNSEFMFHYKYDNGELLASSFHPNGSVWTNFFLSSFIKIEDVLNNSAMNAILLEKV